MTSKEMSKFGAEELLIEIDQKWNSVGLTIHELFGLFRDYSIYR